MSKNCMCAPAEVMIFSCSGGSNVGQLTNKVALDMAKKGKAKMYCTSGLGAKIQGIIENTRSAKKIIVIDGCPISCTKKIFEQNNINIDEYIVVTEEGIEKIPNKLNNSKEELEKIKNIVEKKIEKFL